MEFRTAEEVQRIAEDLIFEHHDQLAEIGPKIECVFLSNNPKSRGRELMGRVRKVSGIHAWLAANPRPESFNTSAPGFFLLEVAQPTWVVLDPDQRKALVDHLLMHLAYDEENDSWRMRPPQFGEFPEVIERWGFWWPDAAAFKDFASKAAEQLSLLPDEEETAGGGTEQAPLEPEPVGARSE